MSLTVESEMVPSLGRLLVFLSNAASAIRSRATTSIPNEAAPHATVDVLWLADLIQSFTVLGRALEVDDHNQVETACEWLMAKLGQYESLETSSSSRPAATFQRSAGVVSIQSCRDIVASISASSIPKHPLNPDT